jgi:hypothetical protein
VTHFVGTDGQPVHLEKALANASVKNAISGAPRVMCFGFSSSERKFTVAENESLSRDRGINLCEALVALDYVSPERGQQAIAAGFGEALSAKDSVVDPMRERPAIVVGIRYAPRSPEPQWILNAIRQATKTSELGSVDLRNYSGYGKKVQAFLVDKADRKYLGYHNDAKWENHPDLFSEGPIKPLAEGEKK